MTLGSSSRRRSSRRVLEPWRDLGNEPGRYYFAQGFDVGVAQFRSGRAGDDPARLRQAADALEREFPTVPVCLGCARAYRIIAAAIEDGEPFIPGRDRVRRTAGGGEG